MDGGTDKWMDEFRRLMPYGQTDGWINTQTDESMMNERVYIWLATLRRDR